MVIARRALPIASTGHTMRPVSGIAIAIEPALPRSRVGAARASRSTDFEPTIDTIVEPTVDSTAL